MNPDKPPADTAVNNTDGNQHCRQQQHLPPFTQCGYGTHLLCQDWQRADDLVQAAITRLYVGWDRVRGMEHTEAYALDAAANDRPAV
jgi:hypothetical protein